MINFQISSTKNHKKLRFMLKNMNSITCNASLFINIININLRKNELV